ncbi:MAG: hypothetical protein PPP58_04740 [Natronomonas sp.]
MSSNRVPITEEIVAQLRDVLRSEELDDEHNWAGAGFVAQDLGHEELAVFVHKADAVRYYEALQRAKDGLEDASGDGT